MPTDPSVDDVLAVIELVVADPALPDSVRDEIAALRADADDSPRLTHERICRIGEPALIRLATTVPTSVLHRAVPLPVFRVHCARPEFTSITDIAFEREVRNAASPDDYLDTALDRSRIIFPASHSWLVESPDIEAHSGAELPIILELRGRAVPFALMRLTPVLMAAANVEVRRPTGLDAAVALQPQWHPSGTPAGPEYVDRDISGAAVERVFWRP